MFGTGEALREQRGRHLIDFRIVSADSDSDTRWEDRVAWDGNLFGAFAEIYPRLTSRLPVPFRLDGETRIDEGPVHVVLREALVDLLVHADYAETQASLILRSAAGYFFQNPANSRVPEADLFAGGRADPRNPRLVQMFRYIGLADEAGTGIPKIVNAWRELGFRLPAINAGTERYEFTLELRHIHLLSHEDREWLRALGDGWTEAEQLALVTAKVGGEIDNAQLSRLTGRHSADVTKDLRGLRDRGFLEMVGARRGARYRLGPASGEHDRERAISNETSSAGSSTSLAGFDENSVGSQGNSAGLAEANSAGSSETAEELSRLARERRHLDAETRDAILVRLCTDSPRSVRELAHLMDRNEAHLRVALRNLVRAGRMTLLYPELNHPKQKYVAVNDSNLRQS